MLTRIASRWALSCVLACFVLTLQATDVTTSFEFNDLTGSFILGSSPNSVTFTGGEARTLGVPPLYHSGTRAFLVDQGDTAEITFETPAAELTLFLRDQNAQVASVLTVLDVQGQVIDVFNGTTTGWTEITFTFGMGTPLIGSIQVTNNSTTGGRVSIDDFSFCAALAPANVFFFPQIGAGQAGDIQFQTTMVFDNTGTDSVVKVEFFDSSGNPLVLSLGSLGTDSSFIFSLLRGESISLQTPDTGVLMVGYAQIMAETSVGGTAVFTRKDAPTGVILFEAGVPATGTLSDFTVAVNTVGSLNTGLALVNPPASVPVTATVTLRLYDQSFTLIAQVVIMIDSGEHQPMFISEFFMGVPLPPDVEGSMTVASTLPLAAVTLRQNEPPVAFPMAVPTLTTFPVIAGRAD